MPKIKLNFNDFLVHVDKVLFLIILTFELLVISGGAFVERIFVALGTRSCKIEIFMFAQSRLAVIGL